MTPSLKVSTTPWRAWPRTSGCGASSSPFGEAELRRVRQNSVDFICQETGGPCFYTGPGMAEAHEGTGITAADWERAAELMAETLDARGVMGELRDELGTFLVGLREDIVDEE
jgi:hemoglobin